MRKNAVDREIHPVLDGICAVTDFSATAISCGFRREKEKDLALIVPKRRCPVAVACPCDDENELSAFYKKRLKNGYAQAILLANGFSYTMQDGGFAFAETVCREVDLYTRYSGIETLFFAVGGLDNKIPTETLVWKNFLKELPCALGNTEENSICVVRALKGDNVISKQLSFSFFIGDVLCKMGVICRSGADGMLVLITTDANVSQRMLQRALDASVRDTLRLLCLGYPKTPNDCVCILANGNANNYLIDCADSEYKKFDSALRLVLIEVCKTLALGNADGGILACSVIGMKSKQTARAAAKALAQADCVRLARKHGRLEIDSVIYTILQEDKELDINNLQVCILAGEKSVTIFEDGRKLAYGQELVAELFSARETRIEVRLNHGNYAATAYGRSIDE